MSKFKKKSANTKQEVPTASLPDMVFILLIFFMVTTVIRQVNLKVRVILTNATNIEKIEEKRLLSYIYMGPEKLDGNNVGATKVQIDDVLMEDIKNIRTVMYDKLIEQPKLIVSLRVDIDSEMGLVTDVKQELREAGTLRINYSTKRKI
jgi:biopolymer transport protein ExbD